MFCLNVKNDMKVNLGSFWQIFGSLKGREGCKKQSLHFQLIQIEVTLRCAHKYSVCKCFESFQGLAMHGKTIIKNAITNSRILDLSMTIWRFRSMEGKLSDLEPANRTKDQILKKYCQPHFTLLHWNVKHPNWLKIVT